MKNTFLIADEEINFVFEQDAFLETLFKLYVKSFLQDNESYL